MKERSGGRVAEGGALALAGRPRPGARLWPRRLALLCLRYGILLVLTVIFFGPWLYLLSMSLKTPDAVLAYPPQWIPQPLDWQNYPIALTHIPYFLYLRNTLFLVVVTVAGQLLSCSLVAYSLACVDWPGRNRLLIVILATLMLPAQVTLIPIYIIFSKLHWVNTFLPLSVPAFFGNATYIFLLRQFFLSISRDVSEAARIDGAGELSIYARIILPIARPALLTVAILTATATYNDFFGPLIYLTDNNLWTLALGLQGFIGTRGSDLGGLMAATIFYALPAVALFLVAQRIYLRGLVLQNFERL
jgi:ABC-type glycerol-3-phosphate transport system permease component